MRPSIRLLPILLVAALPLTPRTADAARPVHDDPSGDLVLADGARPRAQPRVEFAVPAGQPAWAQFITAMGGQWRAVWDTDTQVPLRIWGSGVDAPGSQASAADAERVARAVLSSHIALLAPGSKSSDFVLASNVLSRGVRSVGFFQRRHGLRVDGGQVSFRFKHNRLVALGSEAFGNLDTPKVERKVSDDDARATAKKWLLKDLGDAGQVEGVDGPFVRVIVLTDGTVVARTVVRVLVRTKHPIGRWAVDLDAATGAPFARRQTLLFGAGQVVYRTPERRPGQQMVETAAALADVALDGQPTRLDAQGTLTWTDGATVAVEVGVTGGGAVVINDAGPSAKTTLIAEDGGSVIWDPNDDELVAAQVNAFISAYGAREYVRQVAPTLRFLNEPVRATVNIAEECNAFSDGTEIYFFQSSAMCENTARLPDVVHHEYGHSVHANAVIPGVGSFDSALSEGGADYLAATIVDDAGMGRGFFYTDEPLRDLNPEGREWRWPEDQGESHQTGQIIGGALWDLRELFRDKYGDEAGVEIVDGFWFSLFERASNILAAYPEILIDDDDDGDLSNGTPNLCAITEIFRAAGLTDGALAGLSVGALTLDRWHVELPISEAGLCPGVTFADATLTWGLRGAPDLGGEVTMTYADGVASADIPPQPEGQVLLYRVVITLENGERFEFPNNPADPMYEHFIGEVRTLYCTDFETDPTEAGWISELLPSDSRRPRNEWEWGAPEGTSGDPAEPFSGDSVVGNDLSGNGRYQGRKAEQLLSPVIDTTGVSNVRLQYRRWLTVEDGDADQAEILIGEQRLWSNLASGTGEVHHQDREWRLHDVDLTEAAAAAGGQVQVTFRISSDQSVSFGGWTIDDFCLVTWDGPVAACGDGRLDVGEVCDDGNLAGDDGCEADCTPTPVPVCGNGQLEGDEICDDGNLAGEDGCEADCTPTPETLTPTPTPSLDENDGCRCHTPAGQEGWPLGLFALVALGLLRRRR